MPFISRALLEQHSLQHNGCPGEHRATWPLVVALLMLVSASWIVSAWAQEQAQTAGTRGGTPVQGPGAPVLEELTVTATKTPRDPITTPGEVNVIPRAEIERLQPQSLEEILRYQPGIDVQNGPRRIGELPVIRGLTGPRILTTVDGARLNFQSGHSGRLFVDVDSLKQIDVVRGPNSALWGSGALGGVLALTTKDPADYLAPGERFGFGTQFGLQGGNTEWRGNATLVARLDEHVEVLTSFTKRSAGDINLGGESGELANSADMIDSGFGKLVLRLSPFDEVKLSVQGFEDRGEVPTNPAANVSASNAVVDRTTRQLTYRLGYTRHNPANPYVNLAGFFYVTTMDINETRLSGSPGTAVNFDTLGFDLRNSTRLDLARHHGHLVTYGVEWYRDHQQARSGTSASTLFPNAVANTLALYLQDEISLWDRLFIIPGLRWDRFQNDPTDQRRVTEDRVSPKIGGVLKVTDFLYLEANYAEGFRAPNFGELFISGTHFPGAVFVPNPDLQPEKSRNVDVGLRLRRDHLLFQHDRFVARGAYFRNSLDDFIDFAVTIDPRSRQLQFRPVNIQAALIKGFEAELAWAFYEGFEFFANYTDITGDNKTDGEPLVTIPPRKGVLGLSYTYAPWWLTVGGRMQIVDDQNRVPEGVPRTGGYTVYDVFANWQPQHGLLKGLRVDVGIDNLTDKEYRRHVSGIPEAGINPKLTLSYSRSW